MILPKLDKEDLKVVLSRLEIFPALALIISLISLGARRREAPVAQA